MALKRLLVVSHDLTLTGAPISLLNLMEGLRDRFEITVAAPLDGELRDRYVELGMRVLLEQKILNDSGLTSELLQSHDALVTNTLVGFYSIHGAAFAAKPSLWIVHEGYSWQGFMKKFAPTMPAALNLATMMTVPCEFGRQLYLTWRDKPIEVVHWGVPPFTTPEPAPAAASDGPVRILQLGTYAERKGQDIALAAMQLLNDEKYFLDIVGKIDFDDYHADVSKRFANVKNATHHGEARRDQTAAIMACTDILIVPSRDEMTPLVILDAMAQGKAVIASDVGGIPEMITDGETGFLFPPENAPELARLIRRLGNDPALRRRIGEAGRRFVLEQRRPEQCFDRYAQILNGIIGAKA